MASSGKKGKGKKGVTLAWNEFVADAVEKTSSNTTSRLIPRKLGSWADETEDDDPLHKEKVVLPSGPRATWGPDIDDNKIPKFPPYLAYISNLPYEVEEDEIEEFFKDLQVVSVRLPRDDRPGKLRGFGYVEFKTRECLIEALSLPDTSIKGRRIRIDVAAENDRRRGRDSMRNDRPHLDPERSAGDWRSGPREGPLGEAERGEKGRGGGFMTRDRDGSSGFITRERDGSSGFITRDRDGGSGFMTRDRDGSSSFMTRDRDSSSSFMTRDRDSSSSFITRDRDGGSGFDRSAPRREFGSGGFRESYDRDRGGGGFRDGGREGFGEREKSWFSDRDGDRGRFGDRDRDGFGERGRFGDRDRDFGRDREGGFGGPRREFGRDRDSYRTDDLPPPTDTAGEPRTRPKLKLQPRSTPAEASAPTTDSTAPAPAAATAAAAAAAAAPAPTGAPASIFGGAKPVDTAAREREIEERLARERGDMPRSDRADDGKSRDRDGSRGPPSRRDAPRENVWSRSRQNGPPDDGRASPESDHSERDGSRNRDNSQRQYQEREDSPDGQARSADRQSGSQSGSQHSSCEDDRGGIEDEGEKRGRTEKASSDSGGPRGESRSSSAGGSGSGTSVGRDPPSRSGDREEPKREESETTEGKEEEISMPKHQEQEAPNFAGSNKFAYLHSDEEEHD